MSDNQTKYRVGQFVIYANGSRLELGEIKEIVDDTYCRVWYHTGDTTALTHVRNLSPIQNEYAFNINRMHAGVSYKS